MKDEQVKEHATVTERMLLLLDHAYEAAEAPESYDDLLVGADNFFFPQTAMNGPAIDFDRGTATSDVLERHINRIQKLIDQGELKRAGDVQPPAASRLASLIISSDGCAVIGNQVAADLLGSDFPMTVNDLPADADFLDKLWITLSELQAGQLEGSRVIPLRIAGQSNILLAKCTKLQSQTQDGALRRGLSLTVSHVNWDSDTLEFARDEFSLTPTESELLHEMLRGASQAEAAKKFGKSRETVKVQAKSILRKFGLSQMGEVLSVLNAYAFLANSDRSVMSAPVVEANENYADSSIVTARDGRQIRLQRFGLKGGKPVLFFHGLYQGPFFCEQMDAKFKQTGIDLISPSRPGFGLTSAPKNWSQFDQTVTNDVLDVCSEFGWDQTSFLVHQAGISFACRAAGAMKGRVKSALMVGAGVPIEDHMMSTMNLETRVAAAATRYAPKLFDMLLRLGIAHWRRAGAGAYLKHYFGPRSVEWKSINDPVIGPLMEQGILHMIAQGTKTIIHDGKSAMSDWHRLYRNLDCPQRWIHGDHDPVMNHKFVAEFLVNEGKEPPVIATGTGGDILYAAFDEILEHLEQLQPASVLV